MDKFFSYSGQSNISSSIERSEYVAAAIKSKTQEHLEWLISVANALTEPLLKTYFALTC